MKHVALLTAAAVLGVSCTADRPAARPDRPSEADQSPPRCMASPGRPPEGFVLVRTRELRYTDHVGVREEHRDETGRLLVYLLGVTGEMGEGATVSEDMELSTGEDATLFGTEDEDAWSVVWSDDPPCPQMAIVGNGFTREGFISALRESGVVSDST